MGAATTLPTPTPQAPAEPTTGAPPATTPETPSAAPAGDAGGQPPAEGASGQPAEGDAAAARSGAPPDHVPYGRFRQVQTEYTRDRRQWQQEQARLQRQIDETARAQEAHSRDLADYNALKKFLQANPDLGEAFMERMNGRGGAAGTTGQAPVATLPPKLAADLEKTRTFMEQMASERAADRQAQAQAARAAEEKQLEQELDVTVRKELTTRGYGDAILPIAKAYVLRRVLDDKMDDAGFEDVQYLLADFWKALDGEHQRRMTTYRNGKTEDRSIPATPGSSPPISASPEKGALDHVTSKRLEDALTQLGWNNDGGVNP